jgi:hypothetical protein
MRLLRGSSVTQVALIDPEGDPITRVTGAASAVIEGCERVVISLSDGQLGLSACTSDPLSPSGR